MARIKRYYANRPARSITVFNLIFFCLLCFVTLYPVWSTFVGSVMPMSEYASSPIKVWPQTWEFGAYKSLLAEKDILTPLTNSVIITVVGTALSLLVMSLGAYALSRRYFYGRQVVMTIVLITMLFSGGLIPTFICLRTLGLTNTLWACILLPLVSSYYLIIMRSFFLGLPDSLEESARIDGANDFTVFFRIILPVSMPIVATMILFVAVDRWNDVQTNLMYVMKSDKQTLQVMIYKMLNNLDSSTGGNNQMAFAGDTTPQTQRMAAITITTLPILLVYPFLQKHFVKGVMIGSIKG